MARFMLDPFEALNPNTVIKYLTVEIAEVNREIREIQRDLLVFEDVNKLKVWLKRVRLPSKRDRFDDIPF